MNEYEKAAEFERNEALWALHSLERVPVVQLTELFSLSEEEVVVIIQRHQQYQEEMGFT